MYEKTRQAFLDFPKLRNLQDPTLLYDALQREDKEVLAAIKKAFHHPSRVGVYLDLPDSKSVYLPSVSLYDLLQVMVLPYQTRLTLRTDFVSFPFMWNADTAAGVCSLAMSLCYRMHSEIGKEGRVPPVVAFNPEKEQPAAYVDAVQSVMHDTYQLCRKEESIYNLESVEHTRIAFEYGSSYVAELTTALIMFGISLATPC